MSNMVKTTLLLGLLTALLLYAGKFFGGNSGVVLMLVVSLAFNFGSIFWSHKLAIFFAHGKKADPRSHAALYDMVRELARKAGVLEPALYISPDPQPNAFASGRSRSHSIVCVNQGLLGALSKEELRGVLAHEIAHIQHRDILLSAVAASIAGVIMWIADLARWGAMFGGVRHEDENENGGNMVGLLVFAIVGPLAALLIQMAISRSREFHADDGAKRLLGTGNGLADALIKLDSYGQSIHSAFAKPQTSHLYISNPFLGSGGLMRFFSTHPPVEERVKRLVG